MKTLTRDEFESLVTAKTPVAELPDGSEIDLTINQAMWWFEQASSYPKPSLVLEAHKYVFLGEKVESLTGLTHQIGGSHENPHQTPPP